MNYDLLKYIFAICKIKMESVICPHNINEELLEAISKHNVKLVNILLQMGTYDLYYLNYMGFCSMTLACNIGNYEIIKLLINKKFRFNRIKSEKHPIRLLCKKNYMLCLSLILESNKIPKQDVLKYMIVFERNEPAIKTMMNYINTQKDYLLDLSYNELRFLLEHNVNLKNNPSILHNQCEKENIKSILLLLQYGADVNSVNDLGQTPLHVACKYVNIDIINTLILNNCKANIIDKFGKNSIYYLYHNNKDKCVNTFMLNTLMKLESENHHTKVETSNTKFHNIDICRKDGVTIIKKYESYL